MNTSPTKLLATCALLLSLISGTSCERNSTSEAKNRAEQDLADLREWVKDKTDSTQNPDANKPEVQEELKEKMAKLDSRMDSLSAKSKEEYKELRRKYQNWGARNQQRSEMPLSQETLQRFEEELFGARNALDATFTAAQMRDIYTQFLQNVRARRTTWSAADWDYVDEIYSRLNQKKDLVEDQMSGEDKLKIKALQAEYLTLETGKDAKDLFKEMKQ